MRPPGVEGLAHLLLEDVIRAELGALFPGQAIVDVASFRVARDAELDFDDEGGFDLMAAIEEELKNRRRSSVVRLEDRGRRERAAARPARHAARRSGPRTSTAIRGPLDLRPFASLVELPAFEDLRDPPLKPQPALDVKGPQLFDLLDERDVVLHHPYESFDPVVALVGWAADDPDVLAIKQTLYRTSGDSPVVRALERAAENGKQVTVLVELLARFDEQSNIRWARRLEESGCHVIYGIRGYKTHAKITLVVRRGSRGIRRYVHLGTGNYNEKTARLYTDFGLITSDREIGEDASAFFNALTGYSDPPRMKKLVMAPTQLRERVLRLIRRERERAEAGLGRAIRAKMNSLVDEDIIRALYDAARAGVKIQLNVRGICCLRPGLKGTSDGIEVRLGRRPLPRALAHLPLQQRRRRGGLPLERRLDAEEPRPPDRAALPGPRAEGRQKALAALDAAFADNAEGAPAAVGRLLQAAQARARRGGAPARSSSSSARPSARSSVPAPVSRSPSSRSARPTSCLRRARRRAAAPDRSLPTSRPPAGSVSTQAQTILSATPHFTAESRFVAPTPRWRP